MNYSYIISFTYLALGVLIFLLGVIILKENPGKRLNRVTGMMMLLAGTAPVFISFGLIFQETPLIINLQSLFLLWELFFPQMLLFSFVFPIVNLWVKKRKYIGILIFLPHIFHFLFVTLFPVSKGLNFIFDTQAFIQQYGIIIQPALLLLELVISIANYIIMFHFRFFYFLNLAYVGLATCIMMVGYRKIHETHAKKRVGVVIKGLTISMILYIFNIILPKIGIFHISDMISHLLITSALLTGAGSIAWAIIRYQFLDIRFIIRRGFIVSVTFAVLIGLYMLAYSHGRRLILMLFGMEIPVLELIFMIIALALFQPMLSFLEKLVERTFFKEQLDYRSKINQLSQDIMAMLNINEVQEKMTSTLGNVFDIKSVIFFVPAKPEGYKAVHLEKELHFKPNETTRKFLISAGKPVRFEELIMLAGSDPSINVLSDLNPFLIVPLVYRDELHGLIILMSDNVRSSITSEKITMISMLANQTAIAIVNSMLHAEMLEKKRMTEELAFAREIQNFLLPAKAMANEEYELAGYNLPSKEVGGDYYDFIPLPENKLGIAIGDISGKGVPAAILMSNLQAALRVLAPRHQSTDEVIKQVNSHITRSTSAEKFATVFYSVLDVDTKCLHYTNAGHNYPILKRDGKTQFIAQNSLLLGVMESYEYITESIVLYPGDVLIYYTDGITEAMNPNREEFGEERLLKTIMSSPDDSCDEIINHLMDQISIFTKGHVQNDDLTIIALRL